MSLDKVREFLKKENLEHRISQFDTSSATVELAAEAIGCEAAEIAKTMSFKTGDTCALVVMSGDKKVDNQKFKATFGIKAVMLHPDEVVALVGHAIGGVCPFAVKDTSKVYLDVSLKRFETVYPAAGSSDSVIKLSITELEHLSNSQGWVDVGKQIPPIIAEDTE